MDRRTAGTEEMRTATSMRIPVVVILLATAIGSSFAEEQQAFRAGMTREDVVKMFGEPKRYYSGGHYYGNYPGFSSTYVAEIYSRFTKANEYEIQVIYKLDESTSRLHPTRRIDVATFELDKRLTAIAALEDLLEARLLCASGCAVKEAKDPVASEIYLFPKSSIGKKAPSITLHFDEKSRGGWSGRSIESISFSNTGPDLALAYRKVTDLGSWTPGQLVRRAEKGGPAQ
jgi:hypothetical protein